MNTKTVGIIAGIIFEAAIYFLFFHSESLYPFLFALLSPLLILIIFWRMWNQFAKGFVIGAYSVILVSVILTFFAVAGLFKKI